MAKAIASKGPAILVLTARSIQKAESVAAEITREYPGRTSVQTLPLDLSSGKAVRASAERLGKMVDSIDVLINNAGVMALPERTLSEDGHEMHFATNFLGHFLFTNLVATKLAAAQHGARVVNVVSGGYMLCPIRFHDLKWEGKPLPPDEEPNKALAEQMGLGHFGTLENYNPMLAYVHASTALMLFSLALSERLGKDGVVAITAAPGGKL
jgi:NAD(P)-dependent dehydrogenase (short-subunit alcohol dehydrogenase family)